LASGATWGKGETENKIKIKVGREVFVSISRFVSHWGNNEKTGVPKIKAEQEY
jgi:hypothetical protein